MCVYIYIYIYGAPTPGPAHWDPDKKYMLYRKRSYIEFRVPSVPMGRCIYIYIYIYTYTCIHTYDIRCILCMYLFLLLQLLPDLTARQNGRLARRT